MIGNILAGVYGEVAPFGDYESIATVTVGSGGAADISFTSIPSTFQHLQIRGMGRSSAAGTGINGILAQLNGDTGSNYARHNLVGNGSSASSTAASTTTFMVTGLAPNDGETANRFGVFVCDILDYKDTNKNTTIRTLIGIDLNGSGEVRLTSGLWANTAAITSIKLYPETGNFVQNSTIALYGIKG